ncbi:MAG: GNAT family N-acetyltransferase [Erysipelotrichaceae bacterium]|nr:GNAT family N-acetyltransferase [Erysipelotrichaceae bacterium]
MNADINIEGIELHTERLVLRPWEQGDLNDFYAYASTDGVGQMAGWMPHKNLAESQHILDLFIQEKKTFAIEKDHKCIGSIDIEKYNEHDFLDLADQKARELGFVLSKAYWGQGIMPEAVKEVIRWLLEEKGLDCITCGYFKWNHQSESVQRKCGFVPYRTVQYKTKMNTVEETETNLLTKEDWMKHAELDIQS